MYRHLLDAEAERSMAYGISASELDDEKSVLRRASVGSGPIRRKHLARADLAGTIPGRTPTNTCPDRVSTRLGLVT